MNTQKTLTNPKKIRRARKAQLNRQLTVDEVLHLYSAAIAAGAPVLASRIINIRGGITVAEGQALMALASAECGVRSAG